MEDIITVEKELAEVKTSVKSANKRIDELQRVTKAFYDLASDVKVMVNEMANMKTDITDIKESINDYHSKPSKLVFNVQSAIITGVVATVVASIMALIIK